VEARGQVVHEDAERRGRGGRAPGGEGPEVEERAAGGGSGGGGGEVEEGRGERDEEQQERRAQGHRAAARRPHADTAAGAEAESLACCTLPVTVDEMGIRLNYATCRNQARASFLDRDYRNRGH
jgi:hypothetical protein